MGEEIKKKIIDKIKLLKSGNSHDILIANEMERQIKDIKCFYCLDSQELWGLRDVSHIFFSKLIGYNPNFWIGKCDKCSEFKFLRDSNEKDIITSTGYKMFYRDDSSSEERFKEIKRLSEKYIVNNSDTNLETTNIVETNNGLTHVEEKPNFLKIYAKKFDYNKNNITFNLGIKELVQMLGGFLQSHIGIPNLPLLKEIEASINYESTNKFMQEMFYDSTENDEFFIFIFITDKTEIKKGNFLKIIKGEKYNMNINCKYWVFKTGNQSAINECKKMALSAAKNELLSLSNNLNEFYKIE